MGILSIFKSSERRARMTLSAIQGVWTPQNTHIHTRDLKYYRTYNMPCICGALGSISGIRDRLLVEKHEGCHHWYHHNHHHSINSKEIFITASKNQLTSGAKVMVQWVKHFLCTKLTQIWSPASHMVP